MSVKLTEAEQAQMPVTLNDVAVFISCTADQVRKHADLRVQAAAYDACVAIAQKSTADYAALLAAAKQAARVMATAARVADANWATEGDPLHAIATKLHTALAALRAAGVGK